MFPFKDKVLPQIRQKRSIKRSVSGLRFSVPLNVMYNYATVRGWVLMRFFVSVSLRHHIEEGPYPVPVSKSNRFVGGSAPNFSRCFNDR